VSGSISESTSIGEERRGLEEERGREVVRNRGELGIVRRGSRSALEVLESILNGYSES